MALIARGDRCRPPLAFRPPALICNELWAILTNRRHPRYLTSPSRRAHRLSLRLSSTVRLMSFEKRMTSRSMSGKSRTSMPCRGPDGTLAPAIWRSLRNSRMMMMMMERVRRPREITSQAKVLEFTEGKVSGAPGVVEESVAGDMTFRSSRCQSGAKVSAATVRVVVAAGEGEK